MSDYQHQVGRLIRQARTGRGLTLGHIQVVSCGQISKNRMGMYERGERAIKVEMLARIACLLDVPVADLLPRSTVLVNGAGEAA